MATRTPTRLCSHYRNSSLRQIEQFFEGTGIEVTDYEAGLYLQLVTGALDDQPVELNILLDPATGKLKVWREAHEG